LEPDRGARGHVQPHPVGGLPVEAQPRVGGGEVVVGADLHGPVRGVHDPQRHPRPAGVQRDGVAGVYVLARDHGIGLCTVTSLVPSGKVASTCTLSSISGTPSMTSSRRSTERPASISWATVRPSLAPSIRNDATTPVTSG